ncbi:DUF3289 family protein [Lonsdalea quercina]|uniref:DUF3289 family protein n=1 Tax=Lonsdalea quercina TaxID=71657 RepID=UPI0039766E2C
MSGQLKQRWFSMTASDAIIPVKFASHSTTIWVRYSRHRPRSDQWLYKIYGMLLGFRSWFILQHMKQFGYKPFITVMEMDYPIKGTL